jgi:hypothetical protein
VHQRGQTGVGGWVELGRDARLVVGGTPRRIVGGGDVCVNHGVRLSPKIDLDLKNLSLRLPVFTLILLKNSINMPQIKYK